MHFTNTTHGLEIKTQRDRVLQDILTVKNAAKGKKKLVSVFCFGEGEKDKFNCIAFLQKSGETKTQLISSWMTDLGEIRRLYVSL